MRNLIIALALISVIITTSPARAAAPDYHEVRKRIQGNAAQSRKVPKIPPADQRLRVVIDSDARNEIDDVWALALAVVSLERFQIEGIVAANFDNNRPTAGLGSIDSSFEEIETILDKAGLAGQFPVLRGSPPMRYKYQPSESEGVDFIIEKAMASTPEDPLWVIGLGAATDIASAYLKEPRIAERIVVFWHFRTRWPKQCWNFNVIGDVRAARIVFHSDLSFVLFDTGTHLTCPMAESEQFTTYSPLGRYLHQYRDQDPWYRNPKKGFYDLGDIAALVDPSLAQWETVACPEVDWDLAYKFKNTKGKILRCYDIDRDRTYALVHRKLKAATHLTGRRTEQNTAPVVSRVHTVSIHVKDHDAHEGVYRFLRDDLQMPVVYTPVVYGERRYVGLWAGNLVLEPCGPYPNITYATPDFDAMFYGITFEAYESSAQSAVHLDERGIEHEPPYAFVVISDPNVCGQNLIVSIMDNPGRDKERTKHQALTSELRNNQGGPLGIQYVEEIRVGYTDAQDVAKWKTLLAPFRQRRGRRWQLDSGPALHLVESDLMEISAVVFKVASLESAVRYLQAKNMLGRRSDNHVTVKTPNDWDFTIVLQE
ncbi:MAG: nucleoside hydrolase [Planctomycetota bacterium]|jgi:inosine-uridine nucleoside N-ribohydrolase